MNIILTVGILLVIVAFLTRKSKSAPLIGFAFVFLIMGFQSNVEGDFIGYMDEYNLTALSHEADSRTIEDEPIMPFFMQLFSSFSPWWFFVMALSAIECGILVKFIKKYSFGPYIYLAAILFFFSFNMMLMQMKAMRQGLAIELMLLSFMMADSKKKKWRAIVFAVLAYLTHNSALVIVPFFFLYFFVNIKLQWFEKRFSHHKKSGKKIPGNLLPVIIVGVYFVLYIVKVRFLNQYLLPLMVLTGGEGNRLASYAESSGTVESLDTNLFEISPLIVLFDAIIVFLVTQYYKNADVRMKIFCIISVAAAFGDMLFFGTGSFARIIMYYVVFNLVVYPAVVLDVLRRYGKTYALAFIVLLVGYAIKTSLPWMTGVSDGRFGTYQFVFMP